MNNAELRQKIDNQLDKLSPDILKIVSYFLDSIQINKPKDSSLLRKLPPIKRGKKAQDLLKHTKKWQGEDIEECLNYVRETGSEAEF
ncbi:MAG: hypothetical protein QNJ60_00840 [Xenococcaceae cyanobacterium MO_188.B19]|nr:hypothetical protein [Xenococcaceae cyanobacterium MO_188.B19]